MAQQPEYATYTEKYHLVKPDDKDFYDVGHINGNMDIIDDELAKLEGRVSTVNNTVVDISGLIGKTTDTGGTQTTGTAMAKLNALLEKFVSGGVGIKSVQKGTFIEQPIDQKTSTAINISIATVVPGKTFVIINGGSSAGYTGSSSASMGYISAVRATSFTYQTGRATTILEDIKVSYQVIEFY